MERRDRMVCSVLGFLGLLSAALGFAAEGTKTTASKIVYTSTTCKYPSSPAVGLGLAAAVTLGVAQIMINIATGCICCKRGSYQPNTRWATPVICFVASWITFILAFLLMLNAALNEQGGEEEYTFNCSNVLQPGVFAVAAVLSLATVGLGSLCYLSLESAKLKIGSLVIGTPAAAVSNIDQSGIAMGQPQPQFPPPQIPPPDIESPVFVHEDTYMRRQFT